MPIDIPNRAYFPVTNGRSSGEKASGFVAFAPLGRGAGPSHKGSFSAIHEFCVNGFAIIGQRYIQCICKVEITV
ncbi:hypothetical protein ACFLQU_05550, partial [Verrucomicrobiota bacterium]